MHHSNVCRVKVPCWAPASVSWGHRTCRQAERPAQGHTAGEHLETGPGQARHRASRDSTDHFYNPQAGPSRPGSPTVPGCYFCFTKLLPAKQGLPSH